MTAGEIIAHLQEFIEKNAETDDKTKKIIERLKSITEEDIIIGEDGFYSYRQSGLIDKYRAEVVELIHGKASVTEAKYQYEIVDYGVVEEVADDKKR